VTEQALHLRRHREEGIPPGGVGDRIRRERRLVSPERVTLDGPEGGAEPALAIVQADSPGVPGPRLFVRVVGDGRIVAFHEVGQAVAVHVHEEERRRMAVLQVRLHALHRQQIPQSRAPQIKHVVLRVPELGRRDDIGVAVAVHVAHARLLKVRDGEIPCAQRAGVEGVQHALAAERHSRVGVAHADLLVRLRAETGGRPCRPDRSRRGGSRSSGGERGCLRERPPRCRRPPRTRGLPSRSSGSPSGACGRRGGRRARPTSGASAGWWGSARSRAGIATRPRASRGWAPGR
jgi:hypothetical protein